MNGRSEPTLHPCGPARVGSRVQRLRRGRGWRGPRARAGASPAPTRSGRRPGARAGRRCTRTTRCSTRSGARPTSSRFWFWNSMHFPVPMPAFDVDLHRHALLRARRVAEPRVRRAAGDGHRLPLSSTATSTSPGNPVTDPAKIAERAEFFQERAGYYYANWDELYAQVADQDGGADRRARRRSRCRSCPSTSRTRWPSATTDTSVLRGARRLRPRAAACRDLMWQHHFEFLLLGYGAYMTFVELLQGRPPRDPRPAHRADGRRASTCCSSGPTPSCGAWRGSRSTPGVDARVRRGPLAGGDRRRAGRERRGPRVARGARGRQGPVVQHGDRRRPLPLLPLAGTTIRRIPYASLIGYIARARARATSIERPTEEHRRASATASPSEYARAARRRARRRSTSCWRSRARCSRTSRSTSSICDYWFLTSWFNKIREFGGAAGRRTASSPTARTSSTSRATRSTAALDELVLTGRPAGSRAARSTGRRSSSGARRCSARLADWTPPPALGAVPEAMNDPIADHALGRHDPSACTSGRATQDGGSELSGSAASPGVVEGSRAWSRRSTQIGDVREGEILVCGITSPAWAPIFSKIAPRSPTSAASCPTPRSSAASTGCRRWSAPAARPAQIKHGPAHPRRRHRRAR